MFTFIIFENSYKISCFIKKKKKIMTVLKED